MSGQESIQMDTTQYKLSLALRAAAIILAILFAIVLVPGLLYVQGRSVQGTGAAVISIENKVSKRQIFVGGAVLREGYYNITPYFTYEDIFLLCGLNENALTTEFDRDKYTDFTLSRIIVGYTAEDGTRGYTINAATAPAAQFIAAGISAEHTAAIMSVRAYVQDKQMLREALGDEVYGVVSYRLYFDISQ